MSGAPGSDVGGRTTAAGAPTFAVVAYDDPDSLRFVEAVQRFYVERYGGADRTPVDPAEFARPRGLFLLGRLDGVPVCCGGWRRHDADTIGTEDADVLRPGDAEIKRMWVDPGHRRRGLARRVLTELERTAACSGCIRTVLETGTAQPEALALYRAAGYRRLANFGVYRGDARSLCFVRDLPAPHDGAEASTG